MLQSLFAKSGIPLQPRTFWRVAALFWGGFAVVSYIVTSLVEVVRGETMLWAESVHWLVRWLLWFGSTPLIVLVAHAFPVAPYRGARRMWQTVLLHLGFNSLLIGATTVVEYLLIGPLYEQEAGVDLTARNALSWALGRYSTSLAIYMLVVLGYSIIAYVYQNRRLEQQNADYQLSNAELRNQLTESQLRALRMQLNPHFLFNAHQAIIGLILQHNNRDAISTIEALSEMLRSVITDEQQQQITLREELAFVDKYLGIQQIRFRDRLRLEQCIDDNAWDCRLPSFILQPLVENAVVHGIEGLAGPAIIAVEAQLKGEVLEVSVRDNGDGAGRPRFGQASTGVGLKNTRARLQQLYGDEAELQFQQTAGQGTTVTVRIPVALQPQALPV